MTTERLEFVAGSNYLNTITMRQSGSVTKGLVELYQNSCDSKSKKINITVDSKGFKVTDDGLGFVDENHVDEYFAVVAFDHDKGIHADSERYSQFGLGRFQLAGFGALSWRSNEFKMEVDFASGEGAVFDKTVGLSHQEGCVVEGVWYKPLKESEVETIEAELARRLCFGQVNLTINGNDLNAQSMDWDVETDTFYLKYTDLKESVKIYNAGVWVTDVTHKDKHGGILVSKKMLSLNTARDMVLERKCPIWKEAAELLKKKANEFLHLRSRDSFKKGDYHVFLNALLNGDFKNVEEPLWKPHFSSKGRNLEDYCLIPSVRRMRTVFDLLHASSVAQYDKDVHKSLAKYAGDSVFIYQPSLLTDTGCSSIKELADRLCDAIGELEHCIRPVEPSFEVVDSEKLKEMLVEKKEQEEEIVKQIEDGKKGLPSSQVSAVGLRALDSMSVFSSGTRYALTKNEECSLTYGFRGYSDGQLLSVEAQLTDEKIEEIVETGISGLIAEQIENCGTFFDIYDKKAPPSVNSRTDSNFFLRQHYSIQGSFIRLFDNLSKDKRFKLAPES